MEKKLIILVAVIIASCSKPLPYESAIRKHYIGSLRVDIILQDVTVHGAMTKQEVKALYEKKLKASKETVIKGMEDFKAPEEFTKDLQSYIDNPPAIEFLTVRYRTESDGPVHVAEFSSYITGQDTVITELY